MSGWLWLLAALALAGVYLWWWRRWVRRNLRERYADEVRWVSTPAGYVTLHRYLAPEKKYRPAVVLCHGLGANRFNFDLEDDTSLARYLVRRGFEVWSIELRGCGLSRGAENRFDSPRGTTFDDLLQVDLPAALERIRQFSPELFWVGHSLGGLLGLVWAGMGRGPRFRGLVAIGSPLWLAEGVRVSGGDQLVWLGERLPVVYFRHLARWIYPFLGWGTRFFSRALTTGQMTRSALAGASVNLVENTPSSLVAQLWGWKKSGRMLSADGRVDFFEQLSLINEPVLLLGAEADPLAPPASIFPGYEKMRQPDRQIRIFGRDRGDEHDYAHGDLLLGRHAAEEIFPVVADWLEAHASEK
jgi:alpha-beta hydrolase superfamily lysophospholipase